MEQVRVAIYCRVSTDEQAESGFSIPEQKRELLAHAEREGWEVVDTIVDDGYSGAVGVRPGLNSITELAEAGKIDLVLAKRRDRLFRDRYISIGYERSLQEHGVRLVALDDAGHRFADAVMDEFSDWYREVVRENTIAGRMQKAREGRLVRAAMPPFAFKYAPDGESFVVVPEKMAVVERIMREVAAGTPILAVKHALERDGIPSPTGKELWSRRTLRDITLEDAYRPVPYAELSPMLTPEARERLDPNEEYGIVWYPRRRVKRLEPDPTRDYRRPQRISWHPKEHQIPIPVVSSGIPRELIDAARAAIADNRRPPRSTGRVFELLGVIRCAECRNRLTASRKTPHGKTYYYYRCPTHQRDGSKGCPMNRNLPAEETERVVLHAVLDAVKDRDELIRKAQEDYQRERTAILRTGAVDAGEWYRRLNALDQQKARLQHAYAEGVMSLQDLAARTAELDREREHIKRLRRA